MISRALVRQIAVFGLIGIFATLVHYLIALILVEFSSAIVYIANLVGYLCAVFVSYFGHGLLTFRSRLTQSNLKKFSFVSVSAFILSEGVLTILEEFFQLPHRLSLAIIVCTIPVFSFLANKFWVFNRH